MGWRDVKHKFTLPLTSKLTFSLRKNVKKVESELYLFWQMKFILNKLTSVDRFEKRYFAIVVSLIDMCPVF